MTEVVGIIGNRGGGKTCFMTSLLYMDHVLGHKIICNYHVNFPAKYLSFEKVAELPPILQDATLGFDELGIGADSRNFFSKRNNDLGKLITQLRKRNCLLYYTVQRLNLIDKRIRQQTDYYILMEKHPDKDIKDRFIVRILDQNWEMTRKTVFKGAPFFELYDTNEIIEVEDDDY